MENLRKDLQAVTRELKALIKKFEKISVAVDKMEKPKAAKKTVAKKTVAKKPGTRGATGIVFGLIKRSGKGVSAAELVKKTGFDKRKVGNVVFRLRKQGKIQNAGRAIYVKA